VAFRKHIGRSRVGSRSCIFDDSSAEEYEPDELIECNEQRQ
jgi:hypothetical protein